MSNQNSTHKYAHTFRPIPQRLIALCEFAELKNGTTGTMVRKHFTEFKDAQSFLYQLVNSGLLHKSVTFPRLFTVVANWRELVINHVPEPITNTYDTVTLANVWK